MTSDTARRPRRGPALRRKVQALRKRLSSALHCAPEAKSLDFLISSLTEEGACETSADLRSWLVERGRSDPFEVRPVPLDDLRRWKRNEHTGDLEHESGGFFAIRGLRVRTNVGPISEWTQPIIHQPEIGILGIVARRFDGVLHFLMQAKAEPGNINTVQLSPTVQATRSNFLQRHGGKSTRYLEYFLGDVSSRILVDQLQSEQGARFFRKRNRNVIVQVPDEAEVPASPDHRWFTLGQIQRLLREDDRVNMDTRSVLSGIAYGPEAVTSTRPVSAQALRDIFDAAGTSSGPLSALGADLIVSAQPMTPTLHSMDALVRQMAKAKFSAWMESSLIPLQDVTGWSVGGPVIRHDLGRYFRVLGVSVEATHREVTGWDQPIIEQVDPGLIGFVVAGHGGVPHILVQLKAECGVLDILEGAPTVQCITGNYEGTHRPLFVDHLLTAPRGKVAADVHLSEEGGRFFRESNRNMIVLEDVDVPVARPDLYVWMTLGQARQLVAYSNLLNVEARSLLSLMSPRLGEP